jgi:hypothetical protein
MVLDTGRRRMKSVLLRTVFTICVIATDFPSLLPPSLSPCFKCRQDRVSYHTLLLNKNPRSFDPGVLLNYCVPLLLYTVLQGPHEAQCTINTILNHTPGGGHKACLFGCIIRTLMYCLYWHLFSYKTKLYVYLYLLSTDS